MFMKSIFLLLMFALTTSVFAQDRSPYVSMKDFKLQETVRDRKHFFTDKNSKFRFDATSPYQGNNDTFATLLLRFTNSNPVKAQSLRVTKVLVYTPEKQMKADLHVTNTESANEIVERIIQVSTEVAFQMGGDGKAVDRPQKIIIGYFKNYRVQMVWGDVFSGGDPQGIGKWTVLLISGLCAAEKDMLIFH